MANVSFLRGVHSALPTNGNAVDGVFYLTTDTHRLYVGDENKNLIDLNKYIKTVETIEDLTGLKNNAVDGDFYYVAANNLLTVFKGEDFILINQNTDTKLNSGKFTVKDENLTTKLNLELTDSDGKTIEIPVVFEGGNGIFISPEESNNNTPSKILIDGITYELQTTANTTEDNKNNLDSYTVALVGSDGESTSFNVIPGDKTYLSSDNDGNLTIGVKDDKDIESVTLAKAEGGEIQIVISEKGGNEITGTSTDLRYKIGETSYDFGSALPVYTKADIDEKMKTLDAMTYKGTVGNAEAAEIPGLPNSEVKAGDTYLVVASTDGFQYDDDDLDKIAYSGDLLIAAGSEGNDGFIPSDQITWTYVPAGDDAQTDTTYRFVANKDNNSIVLTSSTGSEPGAFTISSGNDAISVSSELINEDQSKLKFLISHEKLTPDKIENTVVESPTFDVISELEFDDYGHVSKYTVDPISVPTYSILQSTASETEEIEGEETPTGNAAILTTLKNSKGQDVTNTVITFVSNSENIKFAGKDNNISVSLEWGTFGSN